LKQYLENKQAEQVPVSGELAQLLNSLNDLVENQDLGWKTKQVGNEHPRTHVDGC
jgi:hypothetical protein